MTVEIGWKTGFEIELTAPPGRTRMDLANALALKSGGSVEHFFHPQSEPSKVPGRPTFENLTQGFQLFDSSGQWVASFVDDLTLQADFRKQTPSQPGWYRIIADESRLLRLVIRHCDPTSPVDMVLDPLADLFGTKVLPHESGMYRVVDDSGASVAICAPLPGERERPCEIVTAPITSGHHHKLSQLLDEAIAQDFAIPVEGATHIHFDASPLCSAPAIAKLVSIFEKFSAELKSLIEVNRQCVRLGAWPDALRDATGSKKFQALNWPEAKQVLSKLELSKFCDFNLLNIATGNEQKHTFEIRILPSMMDSNRIVEAAALFEGLLGWCIDPTMSPARIPNSLSLLLDSAPVTRTMKKHWQRKIAIKSRITTTTDIW